MRKLALLLFAFALPAFAATYENVIVRDGDRSYMDVRNDTADLSGLGRRYAYFERDGVAYVIFDTKTLARIQKELRPQVELGEEQARLGEQQAALGAKQATLGSKQAVLGAEQAAAALRGEDARRQAAAQRELAREQRALADQQRPLADQQRVLGEKQREAARVAKIELGKIFEQAVSGGVAKRR